MVSESIAGWTAAVEFLRKPRDLQSTRETLLVFPITGPASLEYQNGECTSLNEWDLAVLTPGDAAVLGTAAEGSPLVFLAALDDNSL